MRTDDNRNPTAFTTDIAKQAGLILGIDYEPGTPFPAPSPLVTAKLLGDPVSISIRVIDAISYYMHTGAPRWNYIMMPIYVWNSLSMGKKRDVIGFHYQHEGNNGTMRSLFPNYGEK